MRYHMQASEYEPIVAFTLAHYLRSASLSAMAHLTLDGWPLASTSELRFWRLLGVGKGRVFDPHADLKNLDRFSLSC